jgi:transposase-like protein
MPNPRDCRNPHCPYCFNPPPKWYVRAGTYFTAAHGVVQRFQCRRCGKSLSAQTESMHYYAKRRVDLAEIFSRIRGGSSLRDIGRELGLSRTAIANAALRLGRQAMSSHIDLMCSLKFSGSLSFDGLISAVTSRDYPSQITTLGDSTHELLLAMTHCVTERGGTRTKAQQKRIERRRQVWSPQKGGLTESISLLVRELTRFAGSRALRIDTDEHPIYPTVIDSDAALGWYRKNAMLEVRRTSGAAPRTTSNPLFLMNHLDRMIRHRVKEHTRETIAGGRNSTFQMHRMWIFAWDHNTRQPMRVEGSDARSRAVMAGAPPHLLAKLEREFYTRRHSLRGMRVPESSAFWLGHNRPSAS